MTIRYMREAASAKYSPFFRLIFRWKGSVHKAILPETIAYGLLFGIIFGLYQNVMTVNQKLFFENFCKYCQNQFSLIPIGFVLGFFVNLVATRWWQQFLAIPFPDTIAIQVSSYIDNSAEEAREYRKSIIRYVNLSFVMCMRNISVEAMRLFKSSRDFVLSGLITNKELSIINELDTDKNTMMIPITWAYQSVMKARELNYISGPVQEVNLLESLMVFQDKISMLHAYIWINPPLIYTQIATITVYIFCLMKVFTQQIVVDQTEFSFFHVLFIHSLTYLEFVFYMGWLKVAESLTNPFGSDDEDFDIKPIIERNIKVTNTVVDDLCRQYPPITQDYLWGIDKKYRFPHLGGEDDDEDEDESVHEMFVGTVADMDVKADVEPDKVEDKKVQPSSSSSVVKASSEEVPFNTSIRTSLDSLSFYGKEWA